MHDTLSIIKTRQNPEISRKKIIWDLIRDSYVGGENYINSNHLWQYSTESDTDFQNRRRRAVFFNHTQPAADMLTGFLYSNRPEREFQADLQFLIDNASKGETFEQFMNRVATQSLLYTVGVLVDSPSFEENQFPTMADRLNQGLNPFCVMYNYNRIRDFHVDENGELEWILLDNSYVDSSNPFEAPDKKVIYTLWDRFKSIDFDCSKEIVTPINEIVHNLGKVPFVFSTWRDLNQDHIAETPFEDIAIIDRQIYNLLSYLDENIAASSFKALFYPVDKPSDMPTSLITEGTTGLSVIPFKASGPNPFFASSTMQDVGNFIDILQLYEKNILEKIGLDTDSEKNYVQSGEAKMLEYKKMEALLRTGANSLENVENKIFEFCSLWLGVDNQSFSIYANEFVIEDIDKQLERLQSVYLLNNESVKEPIFKEMVKKSLSYMDESELSEILKDVKFENNNTVVSNTESINVNEDEQIKDDAI